MGYKGDDPTKQLIDKIGRIRVVSFQTEDGYGKPVTRYRASVEGASAVSAAAADPSRSRIASP